MSQPVAKPWYVDLVKEIGGLGLVLVMLVGLYFIAKDFVGDMNTTWGDIKRIIEADNQVLQMDRQRTQTTIAKFIAEQEARMTEQDRRMNLIEDRMSRLEQ